MAEPSDRLPGTVGAAGSDDSQPTLSPAAAAAIADAAQVRPGDPGGAAYPVREAEYWREAHTREPYYEQGRSFEDYSTAYELGWVSCNRYGGDFEPAERVLANDWPVCKGVSTLSWEQALPAARAAWQRAENARSYVSDGTASPEQVLEALRDLLANACDGELGFMEAASHSATPELVAFFERLGQSCSQAAADWQAQIVARGANADDRGTVGAAAHRAWLQIRRLFGGASDGLLLDECERGLATLAESHRQALQQNLPLDLHAMVQRQFEDAQRNRDHIRRLRDRNAAAAPSSTEQPA